MSALKVLAIYRLPLFSNNAIEADRLILEHAVERMREKYAGRLDVDFIEEPEIKSVSSRYDLTLTMAQSTEALEQLEQKQRNEFLPVIWNSTTAVRNCYRKRMSELLKNAGVAYAPYRLVKTDEDIAPYLEQGQPYWLKRGDFHAISDDDVTLAETPTEARIKLAKFREKGVREIILQKHIVGDIYKFYGVEGGFFRAIRVRQFLRNPVELPEAELREAASNAARRLDLLVYGGDAILDEAGRFHLIDLNDWPSFRICREDAGRAIGHLAANYLEALAEKRDLANPQMRA